MTGSTGLSLIYVALLMVLVVSAFGAYRLPKRTMLKFALIWIAIFLAAYVLVLLVQSLLVESAPPPIEAPRHPQGIRKWSWSRSPQIS